MNLINDPWIPIRRNSGQHERIAPWQLTETGDPVLALDAPRPDFNGALIQFLIGLLQTAVAPETHYDWLDWLEKPPMPERLKSSFSRYADAFELYSDKGSFMQDFEPLESECNGIAELLIESPGEQTIKQNKDHFIKRGQLKRFCPACAATALFALQTNAPSGGQGHRTSLRGGGPLTTLVALDENSDLPNDLWRRLWLNILDQQGLDTLTGDWHKTGRADVFPWMAKTRTSEKISGRETTPLDAHPLQMYWGMPRRIRVHWQSGPSGHCDLCDAVVDGLVTRYQTKNYGINYTGAWQHPLSPHSVSKAGDLLPQHAQPGGMTYQHWLGFVEGSETRFSAAVVKRYRTLAKNWDEQLRLLAFGYDMDNMKARCWYEAMFPLFTVPDTIRLDFANRVQVMTEAARDFAGFVRSCVKEAWFSRSADAKGDTTFLTQVFYHHTEQQFYQAIKALQAKLVGGTEEEVLHAWHGVLCQASLTLFDYWAARGDIAQANPRRIVEARSKLRKLAYSKKVREALQLPNTSRSKRSKSKTKEETA